MYRVSRTPHPPPYLHFLFLMACVTTRSKGKCSALPCMACVGKPIPYVNQDGCLEVDGIDMLRYQMVTQQLASADNNTRHPQSLVASLTNAAASASADMASCGRNGQYLQQPTVGTTSTLGGSFAAISTSTSRNGDTATFGGRVYNGATEPWYPYKAGSCGRGYQSVILFGPTSVRQ